MRRPPTDDTLVVDPNQAHAVSFDDIVDAESAEPDDADDDDDEHELAQGSDVLALGPLEEQLSAAADLDAALLAYLRDRDPAPPPPAPRPTRRSAPPPVLIGRTQTRERIVVRTDDRIGPRKR